MKFIFPKNYDFKSKLFGVFDYFTLVVNIIFDLFIFCLCNLIFTNENVFLVLIYIFKYFIKPKVYLYNK